MAVAIERKHVYKISRGSTYLGILPNVKTPFAYQQNMFTTGAQLTIGVALSVDTATDALEPITDESGVPLTTEDGVTLTVEKPLNVVGDSGYANMIRNDNLVEVIEYSPEHPNGTSVFSGYIAKFRPTFGGDEDVVVTVISNGQDLDQYVLLQSNTNTGLKAPTATGTPNNNWTNPTNAYATDGSFATWNLTGSTQQSYKTFGFGVPSGAVITGIEMQIKGKANIADYVSVTLNGNLAIGKTIPLTTTNTLYTVGGSTDLWGRTWTSADFADGTFLADLNVGPVGGGGISGYPYSIDSIAFKIYYVAPETVVPYTSQDPSTILTSAMTNYTAQGGVISVGAGFSLTGRSVSYTFNTNTILEAIQKVYELGPSNWYWYVSVVTGILYYAQSGTTADHTLIKGKHIEKFSVEFTKENIKNVVYASGGEVSTGVNAYAKVTDTTSLANNRRGMTRLNDPKSKGATGVASLTTLATNLMAGNNVEQYVSEVEVNANTYDITLFSLGQIVGFSGFGTFADQLLLQIVGVSRRADSIILQLGVLPHRATEQYEELQRSLNDTQTNYNPSVPS